MKASETPALGKENNTEYNCVATSSTYIQSKSENLLIGSNNNIGDIGSRDDRITIKDSVVREV